MKIKILQNNISSNPKVEITYFIPDERKNGGKYITINNNIEKIDKYKEQFTMQNGLKIDIKEILNINSEAFKNIL